MGTDKCTRRELTRERVAVFKRDAPIFSAMATSVIGRATVQLFQEKKPNVPAPVGSGVLFKASNMLFLLTAAHVADEFHGKLALLGCAESLLPIRGMVHASTLPASGSREDDSLDFAVMRIDGQQPDILKNLAATPLDIYDPPADLVHGKGLVFSGFPSRNYRIVGKKTIESKPLIAETHGAPPDWYQRLHLPAKDHILMSWFNTAHSDKGLNRTISLRGMSGGGVWLVPALIGEPWPTLSPFVQPKLMGIFTEHRKDRAVLLATRICLPLALIMKNYPGVLVRRLTEYPSARSQ